MSTRLVCALAFVIGLTWVFISYAVIPNLGEQALVFGTFSLIFGAACTVFAWMLDRRWLLNELDRSNADHFTLAASISEWDEDHTVPLTTELVKRILENANAFEWTLQGFGMLRLHLGRYGRIHIWDPRYKFLNASEIHDHFWPLKSRVISGRVTNHRYSVVEQSPTPTHLCHHIVTGTGGGPATEPIQVQLVEESAFEYGPGEFYDQSPTDVHRTEPEPGTVTLMARPMGAPGVVEEARSFWPIGETWGTAEPRKATSEEVHDITQYALKRWLK